MRLLVVEDEEKVVRFVTLGLKADRFAVDDSRDGSTGLEMECHSRRGTGNRSDQSPCYKKRHNDQANRQRVFPPGISCG